MPEFPLPIAGYIRAHLGGEATLAYFLMDKEGKVLDWGGALGHLGIVPPKLGQDMAETLIFMEGLLPLEKPSLKLPSVKMKSNISTDVHLFQTDEGYGLLLVDATVRETDLARFQQKAHDLALLREKNAKIMEKDLGKNS